MDNLERELFREIRQEQRDSQTMAAQQGQRLLHLEEHYKRLAAMLDEESFAHRLTICEERLARLVNAANTDTTRDTLLTLQTDVKQLKERSSTASERWWRLGLNILEKVIIGAAAAGLAWLVARGKI